MFRTQFARLGYAIKNVYVLVLVYLVRRIRLEPVSLDRINLALSASLNLNAYIQVSGALHELWDRNPRAIKKIQRLTKVIHGNLIMGMTDKSVTELTATQEMAISLNKALNEIELLRAQLVALQSEHVAPLSNHHATTV